MNAELQPSVLKWARLRAGLDKQALADKVGVRAETVESWEKTGSIPYSKVEKLAEKTHTAFGFLFLPEPPSETLPISDFRRVSGSQASAPASAELLSVIYQCQRRQNWYREYLLSRGAKPLSFAGKSTLKSQVHEIAEDIRNTIGMGPAIMDGINDWEEVLRNTMGRIEDAGILVNRTSFAGTHNQRKLSVKEFRGFALFDEYAPLVFVNGSDVPAAQMFTLAHEVVHIWIGESAVFNLEKTYSDEIRIETFCNNVAAEVLVPMEDLKTSWDERVSAASEIERLSRKFKVSRIVIARRAKDAGFVPRDFFNHFYNSEVKTAKKATGGNYYLSKPYQASRRLSVALIKDAKNGKTLFSDAMQLLGISNHNTFEKFAESLNLEA